jgi:hypothetical protein
MWILSKRPEPFCQKNILTKLFPYNKVILSIDGSNKKLPPFSFTNVFSEWLFKEMTMAIRFNG